MGENCVFVDGTFQPEECASFTQIHAFVNILGLGVRWVYTLYAYFFNRVQLLSVFFFLRITLSVIHSEVAKIAKSRTLFFFSPKTFGSLLRAQPHPTHNPTTTPLTTSAREIDGEKKHSPSV